MGLLIVLAAAAGRTAQSPVWKGTIAKEGDVVVVKNPKEPLHREPILSLREDLSIGGAGGAADSTFSYLIDIAGDNEGNIYALDLRDACIKVFDRSAKYLRTIGRCGQGPGELGGPFSMTLLPAKDEIFVRDAGGRRISVFRSDGVFMRQIPTRGSIDQFEADQDGNFFVSESTFDPGASQYVLKMMNADLSQSLAELVTHPADESHNPFKPRDRWILDEKGGLIYGDAKSYELRYFNPEGKLVRRVLRDYVPLKVSKADIDEFLDRKTPPGLNPTYEYSTHHAAYRSFFMDDQRHLFVQTWESSENIKRKANPTIVPVEDFQARHGGRIAVLGGLDVNILSAGSEDDVRRRTRTLLDICGERGRYAVGSGNSIPSYIPVCNYLAMVDEALGKTS